MREFSGAEGTVCSTCLVAHATAWSRVVLKVKEVEPIGTTTTSGFHCKVDPDGAHGSCDIVTQERNVYPKCEGSEQFRATRRALKLDLIEVGQALGLTVSQVSYLEWGKLEPVDGWEVAIRMLNELRKTS